MRLPASRPIRVGLVLFILGLVFIAVDVLPFFAGDKDTPLWLNLACLLAPIGLGYAVWVAFRTGQEEQRAALRRVTDAEDGAPDPQIRMTDRSSHVTDR